MQLFRREGRQTYRQTHRVVRSVDGYPELEWPREHFEHLVDLGHQHPEDHNKERGESEKKIRGQFRETKLSVNSFEVERNLYPAKKPRRNFQLKFTEIFAGWNFPLNYCLM